MPDQAKEIKELRRELSQAQELLVQCAMRVEAMRRTLDQKTLAEFEKHLAALNERRASIRAEKSSQALEKMLAEFHGPKQ